MVSLPNDQVLNPRHHMKVPYVDNTSKFSTKGRKRNKKRSFRRKTNLIPTEFKIKSYTKLQLPGGANKVLEKGPKFVPTSNGDKTQILKAVILMERKLRLTCHHHQGDSKYGVENMNDDVVNPIPLPSMKINMDK